MDLRNHVAELVKIRLSPVPRIVLACSGGPDSAVLADIAMALSADGVLGPVTLVHVDHQLREDSAADGERVRQLAEAGGAGFELRRVRVDTTQASLENAARVARYAAIDAVAVELDADWIWLAHTASDQAETVLMRIVRGTGVVGLAGMAVVNGRYVRPLLEISRSDIETYCRERGLATVEDPMNDDRRFFRVRVRRDLLAALREENPRIEEALCRLADSARGARELIESGADELGESAPELADAPVPVAVEAIAAGARAAGLEPLGSAHIAAVLELCSRPTAGTVSVDVPGGRVVREYDSLRFTVRTEGCFEDTTEGCFEDTTEGCFDTTEGCVRVGEYDVRAWQPGDRMRPARLKGRSRKLSDLFTDARVPRERRREARVVVRRQDGEIVWAEHLGAAYGEDLEVSLTPPIRVATNKKLTGT